METKSSSSWRGACSWLLVFLLVAPGCAGLKRRSDMQGEGRVQTSPPTEPQPPMTGSPEAPTLPDPRGPIVAPPAQPEDDTFLSKEPPKVGLILGPGGMRAFAHLGVLKEFARARIPVRHVVGLEWGAVMGALYSNQGQVHDAEWKAFKLRDQDLPEKGFLSSRVQPKPVSALNSFLSDAFGSAALDRAKVDYACPTYSLKTEKLIFLNRGSMRSAISQCLPYPPFYTENQQQIAAPFAVEEAARYLRGRGANLIIFVNVLAAGEIFPAKLVGEQYSDYLLWTEARRQFAQPKIPGVNLVIAVSTGESGLLDIEDRRGLVESGTRAARDVVDKMVSKYGF